MILHIIQFVFVKYIINDLVLSEWQKHAKSHPDIVMFSH